MAAARARWPMPRRPGCPRRSCSPPPRPRSTATAAWCAARWATMAAHRADWSPWPRRSPSRAARRAPSGSRSCPKTWPSCAPQCGAFNGARHGCATSCGARRCRPTGSAMTTPSRR